MSDQDLPPVEKSLKYMAWNVKEMAENIKKITGIMESLVQAILKSSASKEDVPF